MPYGYCVSAARLTPDTHRHTNTHTHTSAVFAYERRDALNNSFTMPSTSTGRDMIIARMQPYIRLTGPAFMGRILYDALLSMGSVCVRSCVRFALHAVY